MKQVISLSLFFLLLPVAVSAQTELLRSHDGTSFSAELLLPSFENSGTSPFTSTFTGMTLLVSGNIALTEMVSARFEVPFVRSKTEFGGFAYEKASLANSYVGIGIGKPSEVVTGEAGVRFNTLPEKNGFAAFSGILGDFPRFERYMGEATAVRAGINVRPRFSDFSVLFQFYPMLWIPRGGQDKELFSTYGLGFGYETDIITLGAGVNGVWMVTERGALYGNKDAIHHVQFEASKQVGIFHPGVMFRIPLDKELDMTNHTLGISVSVLL